VNVLGFDTATSATAVGLLRADGELAESSDSVAPGTRGNHAERLLVQARELLDAASLGWRDIDVIAVGVGPGGYTGLRIGIATARGLAFAHGAALVGVGTLGALAEPLSGVTAVAIIDARRSELFAAAYLDDVEVLSPRVLTPAQLPEVLAAIARPSLAVGDGALAQSDSLERLGIGVAADGSPLNCVSGGAICRLAVRDGTGPATPLYLRLPDAELARPAKR
jgi:tRNA threonylcarbamoyladenosine biosynthesis protein TsaB